MRLHALWTIAALLLALVLLAGCEQNALQPTRTVEATKALPVAPATDPATAPNVAVTSMPTFAAEAASPTRQLVTTQAAETWTPTAPPAATAEDLGSQPTATPIAAQTTESGVAEPDLPITFPIMSTQMAQYFNSVARPQDVALIPVNQLHLLQDIEQGQIRVGFSSWAEAERTLPDLVGAVDIISYNPEHWEQTPDAEKENLVAAVEGAAQLAHEHGFLLMVSPDRRFAESHLGQIAPYADIIGLQGQRIQNDPQEFASWMERMIETAKGANPDVQIFVQVGATQGTAAQMLDAIHTVATDIDGIAIWSSAETTPILQEFITQLRPSS